MHVVNLTRHRHSTENDRDDSQRRVSRCLTVKRYATSDHAAPEGQPAALLLPQ
jgi:hypothetical protein